MIDELPARQLRWLVDMLRTTHGLEAGTVARKLLKISLASGDADAFACWTAVIGLLDQERDALATLEV
jgi:hypothetical protein